VAVTNNPLKLLLQVSGGLPPYTYTYSPLNGLSNTSGSTPFANPEISTLYFVTVNDITGCSPATDSIYVIATGLDNWYSYISIIEIYPNPAGTFINIYYNAPGTHKLKINLFDIYGRIVKKDEIVGSNSLFSLPVHDLYAGIYNIQIVDENSILHSSRIIISNK
jgi:hypothetical protein